MLHPDLSAWGQRPGSHQVPIAPFSCCCAFCLFPPDLRISCPLIYSPLCSNYLLRENVVICPLKNSHYSYLKLLLLLVWVLQKTEPEAKAYVLTPRRNIIPGKQEQERRRSEHWTGPHFILSVAECLVSRGVFRQNTGSIASQHRPSRERRENLSAGPLLYPISC